MGNRCYQALGVLLVALPAWGGTFTEYETMSGFLTGELHPVHPAGNSILFSSEKIVYLYERGLVDAPTKKQFEKLMAQVEVEPGLYRRTPWGEPFSNDPEAQDDYIGVAAASAVLSTSHANRILDRGYEHHWQVGLSSEWRWETWLGRYPAVIAHFHYAVGQQPNYFERVWWWFTIATSGLMHPEQQDPWLLTHMMVVAYRAQIHGWLGEQACRFWEWRMKRQWGSIEAVYARYFGNPGHPLSQP